jgi:hypothetical protein
MLSGSEYDRLFTVRLFILRGVYPERIRRAQDKPTASLVTALTLGLAVY